MSKCNMRYEKYLVYSRAIDNSIPLKFYKIVKFKWKIMMK